MLNQIKSVFLVALVGLFAASCANDSTVDTKNTARQSLETPTTTTDPAATATSAEPEAPKGPTTSMTFSETSFDFGTVDSGEKVRHVYAFENTGDEPLIISNAKGSCGCTVPQWPQEPIAPGEAGEIVVEFDSKNKGGRQTKTVTITANTGSGTERLTITGEVNKAEGDAATIPVNAQNVQVNQ